MKTLLFLVFSIHDTVTAIFGRNIQLIKQIILVIAHLSLFGFFFPDLRKEFGELSGNLLIAILFLSPVSRIVRIRFLTLLMAIRRELGILMGYLAIVHGVGYMIDPLWFQGYILPNLSQWQNGFFFGMVAFFLTLPLLFTSNNLAQKFLGGKKWKWLHRTVYAMFFFAILHRFFIKVNTESQMIIALVQSGILIGSYAFLKLLAWKNFLAPLQWAIKYVESFHVQYKAEKPV